MEQGANSSSQYHWQENQRKAVAQDLDRYQDSNLRRGAKQCLSVPAAASKQMLSVSRQKRVQPHQFQANNLIAINTDGWIKFSLTQISKKL
jgi:hypothetical protein